MGFNNKKVPIDYTARDFTSIRSALVEHAKRYYPDTFQDFNESGFGSLMVDSVAYVGDILSLYLDYQANENYIETAMEEENILKIGKQMGFKGFSPGQATGLVEVYIEIPASADGSPDLNYAPIVKQGATFSSTDGGTFILAEEINFNDDSVDVLVSKVDSDTSVPTNYVMRKSGEVISGQIEFDSIALGDFVEFRKIQV